MERDLNEIFISQSDKAGLTTDDRMDLHQKIIDLIDQYCDGYKNIPRAKKLKSISNEKERKPVQSKIEFPYIAKKRDTRTTFPQAYQEIFGKDWVIWKTIQDGNCGLDAISKALSTDPTRQQYTISQLRELLVDDITQHTFQWWKNELGGNPNDTIKQLASTASTMDNLRAILRMPEYYPYVDDLYIIGQKLDIFIVILNQTYNPYRKRSNSKVETIVACNPDFHASRPYYEQIKQKTYPQNCIMIYGRSDIHHYELLYRKAPPHTIVSFDALPSRVADFIKNECVSFMYPNYNNDNHSSSSSDTNVRKVSLITGNVVSTKTEVNQSSNLIPPPQPNVNTKEVKWVIKCDNNWYQIPIRINDSRRSTSYNFAHAVNRILSDKATRLPNIYATTINGTNKKYIYSILNSREHGDCVLGKLLDLETEVDDASLFLFPPAVSNQIQTHWEDDLPTVLYRSTI